MNTLKNKVMLIGNLGQDPDVRTLESGKKVAKFTLATDESYKNGDGQKVNETQWHNVVAWNGLADITGRYLNKGKHIAVEGRITYRNYEDKNGVTRYITEIIANELLMLDGPGPREGERDREKVKENAKEKEIVK
jgi:single-strand DNA-binding protein